MTDIQSFALAIVVIGIVWAYVWDQKHKRDDALFREKLQLDGKQAGAMREIAGSISMAVEKASKPPTVPGDEWKEGQEE